MTLAKATVTGTVYREPEKRFTSNNIAVSAFVMNIGDKDETLIRVLSKRTALDEIVSSFQKGDRVLVDGRLQIAAVKTDDGSEKRIYEIDASSLEKLGVGAVAVQNKKFAETEEIVKFDDEKFSDELIGEDEIPF